MNTFNRRAFVGAALAGLASIPLGAQARDIESRGRSAGSRVAAGVGGVELANALNLQIFVDQLDAMILAGVVAMQASDSRFGRLEPGTIVLFPFKRYASGLDTSVFRPGTGGDGAIVAAAATTAAGLAPDEYACDYILGAPAERIAGFTITAPQALPSKRPWLSSVDGLAGTRVDVDWTSANLNGRWFAGSRWIPDAGDGGTLRTRIVEQLRLLAPLQDRA